MNKFFCGCKLESTSFTFCSTHALCPEKRDVENRWMGVYRGESDWSQYTADLIVGMSLEEIWSLRD